MLTFTLDSRTWTAGGLSRASPQSPHGGPIRPGWPVSSASSPTTSWLTPLVTPDRVLPQHLRTGCALCPRCPLPPDLCLAAAASSFRPNSVAGETFPTARAAPAHDSTPQPPPFQPVLSRLRSTGHCSSLIYLLAPCAAGGEQASASEQDAVGCTSSLRRQCPRPAPC